MIAALAINSLAAGELIDFVVLPTAQLLSISNPFTIGG
jgi:hypothetical protein